MRFLTAVAGLSIALARVTSAQTAGIRPLTPELFTVAKAEGLTPSKEPINSPLLIRMNTIAKGDGAPGQKIRQLEQLQDLPFDFTLRTPYGSVVAIAREAARTLSDPHFPAIQELNAKAVVVAVGPGSSMSTVDAIQNVVIKRGDTVVRPSAASVKPTTIQNRLGATKESAEGEFTFSVATFSPDVAITLVLIGQSGNTEWTMTPAELGQLK